MRVYRATDSPGELAKDGLPRAGYKHLTSCITLLSLAAAIGDFVMPFRISNHPVCTYNGRLRRLVTLSDCDGYPDPTVEVFDAKECKCQICDSDITSCENLNG
ncbi:glycoprotein hormone beta-5-like [Elysia marginata]|uniref:Glycoprotein hormone beta-5-like n=1 Tax=Elysia marginata TaxID=1093978 RepID=A0AAV4GDE8_9GAST|nr:glycoprotein hormone beta-5-like [Elysia marginata]